MELTEIRERAVSLKKAIQGVVIGQDRAITLILVALLSEGHVLLEGVPGTAKTLLGRTFSQCLSLDFKRIQFTPDLMPGDVIGTNLFNFQTNAFTLTRGAIFTQVLLADEINRTPPKTQAALLQAMQERSVTIDGETHELGSCFMVVATQNPIEHEGTYPLPEAQLDRFLFKIRIDYPSREDEREIVRLHGHRTAMPEVEELLPEPVANERFITEARRTITEIRLEEQLIDYIVDLVRMTRQHPSILCGASPRSANMLATSARAHAALSGRDYVIPDDVKGLLRPAIGHRIVLSPGAEIEGRSKDSILSEIVSQVSAPR